MANLNNIRFGNSTSDVMNPADYYSKTDIDTLLLGKADAFSGSADDVVKGDGTQSKVSSSNIDWTTFDSFHQFDVPIPTTGFPVNNGFPVLVSDDTEVAYEEPSWLSGNIAIGGPVDDTVFATGASGNILITLTPEIDSGIGSENVIIGEAAVASGTQGAVAIGKSSLANAGDAFAVGHPTNAAYQRRITGVKNGQADNDAATVGQLNNLNVPVITMQTTDPGEGQPLAANHFIAVYE